MSIKCAFIVNVCKYTSLIHWMAVDGGLRASAVPKLCPFIYSSGHSPNIIEMSHGLCGGGDGVVSGKAKVAARWSSVAGWLAGWLAG